MRRGCWESRRESADEASAVHCRLSRLCPTRNAAVARRYTAPRTSLLDHYNKVWLNSAIGRMSGILWTGRGPLLAPVGHRLQHLLEAWMPPYVRQMRIAAQPVFALIAPTDCPV